METYCCWLHPYSSAKVIDRQFLPKRSYVEAEEWFSWIFPFGTNLHLRIHWTWLASTRNFSKWASGSYGHAWPSWRWHYSWVWGELHDPANESCTRVCVSCAGQFQACWLHALTFGAIHVFPRLHISWHFRKNAEQRAPEASLPGIPSSIPGKRQGSMRCSMVGDPKKHPVVYHNFPIFLKWGCYWGGIHFSNTACLHFWRLARGGHAGTCSWWQVIVSLLTGDPQNIHMTWAYPYLSGWWF